MVIWFIYAFLQGSVYFAAKMPTATAWLELCAASPKLGRNEAKTKDKPYS